jgi:hypothetical protein
MPVRLFTASAAADRIGHFFGKKKKWGSGYSGGVGGYLQTKIGAFMGNFLTVFT